MVFRAPPFAVPPRFGAARSTPEGAAASRRTGIEAPGARPSRLAIAGLLSLLLLAGPGLADDKLEAINARIGELAAAGQFAEAFSEAESAAARARELYTETSSEFARAVSWKAYLLQVRGKSEQAEQLFEQALATYQAIRPPGHPDIATTINNLGFVYQNTDRLIKAEQMYKQALEMREKAVPRSDLLIADSLNNVAQCYKRQGRIQEAEPLLRRALELRSRNLDPNHPLMAQSLVNLGSTLELRGRFIEAEPFYRKALEIRRKSQPADHPDIAGSLNKLAEVLSKQGRHAEADKLFAEVIEMRYRTQQPGHIDIATSLLARAQNLIELKNYAEAKSSLRNALAIQQTALPPLHPSIALSQAELGRIARLENDGRQALSLLRVAAVSQAARGNYDDLARQHFANFVGVAYDDHSGRRGAPDMKLVDQALEMAQRSAQTETAATVTQMAARFASNDPELKELIRQREEIEKDLQQGELDLSALLALAHDERPMSVESVRTELAQKTERLKEIDEELRTRFPRYTELVSPEPLTIAQTQALLAEDEAVVYYFSGIDGFYLWAVTRDEWSWHRLDPAHRQLATTVSHVRNTLDVGQITNAGVKADLFDLGEAHQLYKWLLKPVEKLIEGKEQLIVVPAGPLTSLPFQLLVRSAPKIEKPGLMRLALYREADWLINHHALTVMPALSSMRAIRETVRRASAKRPIIGIGNPVFQPIADRPGDGGPRTRAMPASAKAALEAVPATPAAAALSFASFWRGPLADVSALRSGLTELPETETELRHIAERLKAPIEDLLLGDAASEANVKQMDLTPYRIVYFATHGLIAGEVKGLGEPALALTVPDQPTELDDGLLTASEVSQLKLDAEWVVLSACNTADPNAAGAEALSGLARSFFHAGARSLMVTHWRVGSEATTKLTTATFDILEADASIGRAEALRRAMRASMADRSDPWSGYPTFWAPFVLVGDGRS